MTLKISRKREKMRTSASRISILQMHWMKMIYSEAVLKSVNQFPSTRISACRIWRISPIRP
jgi:hypothetical protein